MKSALLSGQERIVKIQIVVKPNSRRESVQPQADGSYRVCLNAPPHEGLANERLIELLSEFFKVPKSGITIMRGRTSRRKWVEV